MNEPQIQFIQLTSDELQHLITGAVKEGIKEVLNTPSKQPVNSEDVFLTRKETAAFFKCSLVSIHQWANDGLIKPYKVGNRTYFKKAELIKVLESSNHACHHLPDVGKQKIRPKERRIFLT